MKEPTTHYDLLGIGIGPSNLSLAALLKPAFGIRSQFFEAKPAFSWHGGMLFEEATIQVSYHKDLVTLVDPQSPYSFLAFLKAQRRLYRFLTARFPSVKRQEFDQYFRWVSQQLSNLRFGAEVEEVSLQGGFFQVKHGKGKAQGKHLSLGVGHRPHIPSFAEANVGKRVFHAAHYLQHLPNCEGKRITVVGGGQSGAEVIRRLLRACEGNPSAIHWVTERSHFLPIDDSPFVNEYFFPPYSQYFFQLPDSEKAELNASNLLASDGVSMHLLEEIYRLLYERECVEGQGKACQLHPGQTVLEMERLGGPFRLHSRDARGHLHHWDTDCVVLATGFRPDLPAFLDPIRDRLQLEGGYPRFRKDFSLQWDGPQDQKIFLLNGSRHSWGVADPNLSLLAYRSAKVIHSLLGVDVYELDGESVAVDWQHSRPLNGHSSLHPSHTHPFKKI